MIRKTIEITNFFKGYFYPELGYTNMNYYGIMWFASPFFYKSDNAQPEDDTAQLLSETGQPVSSKDGRFHLLNKYIKDFSNIPSGGIACAHASDSLGVAPTATWNFRTRKKTQCLCVQNKNLVTRIYHISRTAYDMGLSRRA